MPVKCPHCDKEFKTPQGRQGHIQFVHPEEHKSPKKKIEVITPTKTDSPVPYPAAQQLDEAIQARLTNQDQLLDELLDWVENVDRKLSGINEQLEKLKAASSPPIPRLSMCHIKQKQSS